MLVATDIAARGIHVDDIALVVHVDPPAEHKAYLHRSGRTARAGAEGVVVTVMTPDQVSDVKALAKAANIGPIVTRVTPGHSSIGELVGEAAELVQHVPVAVAVVKAKPHSKPRSGSGPQRGQQRPRGVPGGGARGRGTSSRPRG